MKFIYYLGLLTIVSNISIVHAGDAIEIGHIDNEFTRFQQQSQQNLNQLRQQSEQIWINQHQYQQKEERSPSSSLSQYCLPYNGLDFIGITLVDVSSLHLTKNDCISESKLNEISKKITQLYLKKGYIHHSFQFEEDSNGNLILHVIEGKVTALSSTSSRLNFTTLAPHMINKPLNIKDLDQSLDQANKMKGSHVTVDVLPQKTGEIHLSFVNQEKSKINGYLGFDNFASHRHKYWQIRSGFNVDNPLGLSDTLFLSLSHTLKSVNTNFNRSATFFHSIPYGYWTLNSYGTLSKFNTQVPLQYHRAEQRGSSWQIGLKVDYTFHRGENHISTIYTQFEHYSAKNYFLDAMIELQSPKLNTVLLGINHAQLFPRGSLSFDLNYEKGLTQLDIEKRHKNQPHLLQGKFNKWNGELQFNYYYNSLDHLFHQKQRLLLQYSSDNLVGVKQFELLGRNAIRGFKKLSISAEKSAVLQNEISIIYTDAKWQFEPYILMDIGLSKASSGQSSTYKAFALGAGLKVNFTEKLTLNFEWANGKLIQPNGLNSHESSINLQTNYLF